jgi:hypothetical protein
MLKDTNGSIILTDVEGDSVDRIDPATGTVMTLVEDSRLQWPDTMAWGPNHVLFVTASQNHRMPNNHGGVGK